MAAIKRAEKAIDDLKEEFVEWINTDVSKLVTTRDAYAGKSNGAALKGLYRAAHDLKGQGTTFDFPLVTRVAASLCNLTELMDERHPPIALIDAHVDAIKIVVRDNIRDAANPTAVLLASELESRVEAFLDRK
jgi:chemotaxis protein histidine kinase CheA